MTRPTKLNIEDVRKAKVRVDGGESISRVAADLGVARSTLRSAIGSLPTRAAETPSGGVADSKGDVRGMDGESTSETGRELPLMSTRMRHSSAETAPPPPSSGGNEPDHDAIGLLDPSNPGGSPHPPDPIDPLAEIEAVQSEILERLDDHARRLSLLEIRRLGPIDLSDRV
jgi:hypothetical protein